MRYTGHKRGWLPGVPARDLSIEEVERYGRKRLLDSGLYAEDEPEEKEDCTRCNGFGLYANGRAIGKDSAQAISSGEKDNEWSQCPECGSTPFGDEVTSDED